jgi:hypothetical protein
MLILILFVKPCGKRVLGIQLEAIEGEQLESIHGCRAHHANFIAMNMNWK